MFGFIQILNVFTVLALLASSCLPAGAQAAGKAYGLDPGLYYYFAPGQNKPSVHYVPDPRNAYGDPFSKPVRPLPVAGQEYFPTVSFEDLQNCTLQALQAFSQRRVAGAGQAWPQPVYGQAPPAYPAKVRPDSVYRQAPLAYSGQAGVNSAYGQTSAAAAFGCQKPAVPGPNYGQAAVAPGYQNQMPAAGNLRQQQEVWLDALEKQAGGAGAFAHQEQAAGQVNVSHPVKGVTLEQMEEAAELASKALKLADSNRHEEAGQLLARAAQYDPNPNSGVIHHNLGNVHEHLGRLPQAVHEYQLALQFDPKMTGNILSVGSCYQQMGRISDAIACFQQFVQLEPRSAKAEAARKLIASLSNAAKEQARDNPYDADYYNSVVAEGRFRWLPEHLPLRVFIATTGSGYRGNFKQYMCEAFDAWSQASGYRLSWVLTRDRSSADIVCSWIGSAASLPHGDGAEGGQAAVTAYDAQNGQVVIKKAEISIVTRGLKGETVSDHEVRKVCLHEVGHALGLQRHSSNNQDVMFFSETQTAQPALTPRDKATIARLYADYPVQGPAAL